MDIDCNKETNRDDDDVLFGSSNVTVNVTKNRLELLSNKAERKGMQLMMATSCGSMPKFTMIYPSHSSCILKV